MHVKDLSTFGSPFELWREEGIMHLVFSKGSNIGVREVKELVRLFNVMDPTGAFPVMVEQDEQVIIEAEARRMLQRTCRDRTRPVAFLAHDIADRIQGDFFLRFHKPVFPFRVFNIREEAERWARERRKPANLDLTE